MLKSTPNRIRLNYLLIPVSIIPIDNNGAELFNKIYFWIKEQNYNKITFTASGGIPSRRKLPCYGIKRSKTCVEIVLIAEGQARRIQFRTSLPEEKKETGRSAFSKFKIICRGYGIDLDSMTITNGVDIKKEIEKPLIGAKHSAYYNRTYENCHHIDFHSSYAGGLAFTHPEFKEVLTDLYNKRDIYPEYKNILNFTIGFFQSEGGCGARWAHLSKDAIKNNNDRIKELSNRLLNCGRIVLSFNTDGIWYTGKVYHGKGEGNGLGEWHNDHTNCLFRMKSAGAYEFIENGVYTPVVRGIPNEDKNGWVWGDIYSEKANVSKYYFTEEAGVVYYEEK